MKWRKCSMEHKLSSKKNRSSQLDLTEEGSGESLSNFQQMGDQMTIFYNGRIGVYDVTELQARAILLLASHESEQRMMCKTGAARPLPASIPMAGLSMKRSLQRFLQKRKLRAQARGPY